MTIVERLRHRAKSLSPATTEELLEGAAEIERLRAKVNEIDQQLTGIEHLNAREKLELRAEIERLRRLVDEREADLGRMHGETSAREPDDYFMGACPTCGQAYLRAEVERLKAENARLKEIEIKYDQLISGAFI